MPGAEAVAIAGWPLLRGNRWRWDVRVPGQPPQPTHLGRRHRLGNPTERVTGARLDLDEHHRAAVGRDHIQLAVAAPPITFQHLQTQGLQMLHRQPLSQSADLGATPCLHGSTFATPADRPAHETGQKP